jgi:glycosyltransferase involved in cell wall biosynthesis
MTRAWPERQKVMFIINSLTGGGAERVMTTILAHSADRRDSYDMSLALLDDEPVSYPAPDWLPVHRLDSRFSTRRSLIGLRRLVGRERPDVTLSFLTRANVANGFAMAGRGRPWIISERINTREQLGSGARALVGSALVRAAYPRASRIIAVSRGVADGLVRHFGVAEGKIEVISNPVDVALIRRRAGEPPAIAVEPPFVMAMGRLVEKKNFAMLIDAFARSGIPGRLVIAGDGPLRDTLVQQARRLGVHERLVLPGFLSNPYALLARADAFVLSSNAEGFPNALVEALALDIPVIATNCADGPAEILADAGRERISGLEIAAAGILTPPNDAEVMARGLNEVMQPQMRERLVKGGRKRVEVFSISRAVERYWQVINLALAAAARSSA